MDLFVGKDFNSASDNFSKSIYKHLVDNLHQFNNLKAIRIFDLNYNLSYRMTDFLETFTQLNSISDTKYTLAKIDPSKFYSTTNLNIATLRPATNMKTLFLCIGIEDGDVLPVASDRSLIYLMKKFPNLESLHINYFDTGIWLEQCKFSENFDHTIQSAAVIVEFLIYLSKIPYCFVRLMINPNDSTAQVIQGLYTSAAPNENSSRNLKIFHCQSWEVEPEDLQRKAFVDFETINSKT